MSVQAGIWNFQGEPVDRQFLARISQSIAEYAPDGETTYFDGPLGMLYRPFYSTMESRAERQPYISVSGKVITWDGRLDNRDELMTQLRSHPPDDRTDVAIVAAAFERWGMDCFAKLIGDWGLSIWDPREKELILSRDYIGIISLRWPYAAISSHCATNISLDILPHGLQRILRPIKKFVLCHQESSSAFAMGKLRFTPTGPSTRGSGLVTRRTTNTRSNTATCFDRRCDVECERIHLFWPTSAVDSILHQSFVWPTISSPRRVRKRRA